MPQTAREHFGAIGELYTRKRMLPNDAGFAIVIDQALRNYFVGSANATAVASFE
jgi:hypothetical protein